MRLITDAVTYNYGCGTKFTNLSDSKINNVYCDEWIYNDRIILRQNIGLCWYGYANIIYNNLFFLQEKLA